MQKNDLLKNDENIIRILEINKNNEAFIIDCRKQTIPKWIPIDKIKNYDLITEKQMQKNVSFKVPDENLLDTKSKCIMNERYTIIANILPYISDFKKRNEAIATTSAESHVCRQTLINYLCLYLTFQTKTALAPKNRSSDNVLTADEKNFRWALNKFFYNQHKNSLKTTYTLMLKEKYCDASGNLLQEYPTFNQFRYFYRKHKKMQTYYISRDGIKNYQRNHRPLLGDGVQEFAPNIGVAMLDATVCDIYLVNETGNIVGRPILTACIDAYSSLCCGYSLSWEGGVYSLRGLMLNIITDKKSWCKRFGININASDWDCSMIPATLVTDMGSEYKSENFEQITELGVKLINLPPFRPELKGSVEKFFDLIQDSYKPYLKGRGVIEPDYQERGVHDYRKDACLTLAEFEAIIVHCILYYNSQRVLSNFPYTEKMIELNIRPYANCIWNYGKTQMGANLISVNKDILILTLLPRTTGKFCRNGLKVNKMRYRHDDYTEEYLKGGDVTVAYNPDDVSRVWLIEKGSYVCFELIESRYKDKQLLNVQTLQNSQKDLIKTAEKESTQAKIDLANHILVIANNATKHGDVSIKGIRNTRQKERSRNHIDYMKVGDMND